jgi:hypothetical protein
MDLLSIIFFRRIQIVFDKMEKFGYISEKANGIKEYPDYPVDPVKSSSIKL